MSENGFKNLPMPDIGGTGTMTKDFTTPLIHLVYMMTESTESIRAIYESAKLLRQKKMYMNIFWLIRVVTALTGMDYHFAMVEYEKSIISQEYITREFIAVVKTLLAYYEK